MFAKVGKSQFSLKDFEIKSFICGSLFRYYTKQIDSILPCIVCLTNKFHVAVHLSSNRSQMTSKCGKDIKVAHEAIAECVTDVLTTL